MPKSETESRVAISATSLQPRRKNKFLSTLPSWIGGSAIEGREIEIGGGYFNVVNSIGLIFLLIVNLAIIAPLFWAGVFGLAYTEFLSPEVPAEAYRLIDDNGRHINLAVHSKNLLGAIITRLNIATNFARKYCSKKTCQTMPSLKPIKTREKK